MLYFLINNKPILIRSMLAASSPGHVCWRSCKRTKEAKRRQLKATFTVTSTGTFTAQARKSSVSLLFNLIRKTLTRACVLETDVHIYICDRLWENRPLRAQLQNRVIGIQG